MTLAEFLDDERDGLHRHLADFGLGIGEVVTHGREDRLADGFVAGVLDELPEVLQQAAAQRLVLRTEPAEQLGEQPLLELLRAQALADQQRRGQEQVARVRVRLVDRESQRRKDLVRGAALREPWELLLLPNTPAF